MTPTLLMLLTFGAVLSAIAGAYSISSDLYLRDRSKVSRRIDDEFRRRQRARAEASKLFREHSQVPFDLVPETQEKPNLRQRLDAMIEQSGLDLTLQKLMGFSVMAALVLGLLGFLARQSLLIGLVGALFGGAIPPLYVQWKRKARLEKLLSQLPDAFDLMARVIRAGQAMSQAMQAVSDEFAQPIAGEFNFCYEQQNLGLPPEAAFRDLARRCGLVELRIFVLAMIVQQQTGGNLAEMLDKLSGVVRERYKLRGQIKALTAEGRMQAIILLALPPAMFLILLVMNFNYASELFLHPRLIVGTLVCEALGALWIRSIINFDS